MLTLMYVAIYAATPVVELSVIAAVLYTGPLFTTLFSSWINRERVPATSWLGIIGGFVGVLLIILIGIGLAKAYQSAPSAIIAAFDYSYLLFAAFWGFVFFHEVPDALSGVGMILIAVAGLLVISPRSFGNPRKLPQ